jgi:hypothetical protein
MKPNPLTCGLKTRRASTSAFDEDRVANANALVRVVHESSLRMRRAPWPGDASGVRIIIFHWEGYLPLDQTLLCTQPEV